MTRTHARQRSALRFESLESRLVMAALQLALNGIDAGETNRNGLPSSGELFRVIGEESPNLDSGNYFVDHDASGSGSLDPVAPSQPRFLWTAEWQANWERARAENHPWWQLIKSNADKTGTSQEQYADYGQWCALVYQITGDTAYAQKAIPKAITQTVSSLSSANYVREFYTELVILYDWLLPAMTAQQKANYEAAIIKLAEYSLGINQPAYTGGFLLSDSDQTVGQYFGLALTDLALGTDYLTRTARPIGGAVVVIGGLDATTGVTARNTVKEYFAKSAGGQWLESSEYNLGTNKLVLMGVAAIRTATGQEHFPEAVEYFAALKQNMLAELTPDLKDSFQWGDLEHPHSLDMFHRGALMTALGLHGILDETGLQSRGFYFTTPYDAKVTPPAKVVHQAPGIGAVVAKDETKLFASLMSNRVDVHHEGNYLNTFQLWANGEWVIDHPRGYASSNGNTVNGMLLAGLSSMSQRGLVRSGQGDGYVYQIGTTGGDYYTDGYYNPPPDFLHAWTRTVVYLPEYTAIVVYDSIDMDDPEALPGFDRYAAADQAAIQTAPALKQWFLHTPVQPTIQGNKASWQTDGGQNVTLRTLLGGTYTTTVVNEQTDPAFASGFDPSERKWHVRLASNDATAFLNVMSVGPEVASNLLAANKLQIGNYTIEFQGQQVQIVSGNIPGENRFPTAQADSGTTLSGAALTINVLANDSDPDGDLLSVAGFTQPAHGTVTQVSGGLRYAPASGYVGTDNFTYTIADGRGGTATATVFATVQSTESPNDGPTKLRATPGDDTIYLRPDPHGTSLNAFIGDPNGQPLLTWPMQSAQPLMIDTLAGNDQIIIQLGQGVTGPVGGIQLEVGTGDNSLRIESGSILANALSTGGALNTTVGGGAHLSTARLNQVGLIMSGSGTKVTIQPDGALASVLSALSMDANSILDITNNSLILRATVETKDAIHADVVAKIVSAQNGLDSNFVTYWNGAGVTSSAARPANVSTGFDLVGLGVIRNSDLNVMTGLLTSTYTSFGGVALTANDVLVSYTLVGDANLDDVISFDDYVGMDNAFFGLIPNLGWATGDLNLDDTISFDDITAMDQAYFADQMALTPIASIEAIPDSLHVASNVNSIGFSTESGIGGNDLAVVKSAETQRAAPETSSERLSIAISSMLREEINSVADERLRVNSRARTRELLDTALLDFVEET